MGELSGSGTGARLQTITERLVGVAARQFGVISFAQLQACEASKGMIARATARGWLHKVFPRVYAVGNPSLTVAGLHAAALLYAGPGAALSHVSGGWWLGMLYNRPGAIHVSTPRQVAPLKGICLHRPKELGRIMHAGLPVTPAARVLLDIATQVPFNDLRTALAQAAHLRYLDLAAVQRTLGRGHTGATVVREAMARHLPQLARTRSGLERAFLFRCERHEIAIPEVNVRVGRWEVDALFRDAGLAVELDGDGAHGHEVAVDRDRRKELDLRAAGLTVVRYSNDQVKKTPEAVARDLTSTLAALN